MTVFRGPNWIGILLQDMNTTVFLRKCTASGTKSNSWGKGTIYSQINLMGWNSFVISRLVHSWQLRIRSLRLAAERKNCNCQLLVITVLLSRLSSPGKRVSWNALVGRRWAKVRTGERVELYIGEIEEMTEKLCLWITLKVSIIGGIHRRAVLCKACMVSVYCMSCSTSESKKK